MNDDRMRDKLCRKIAIKMLEYIDAYRCTVERYDALRDEWKIAYGEANRLAPSSDSLVEMLKPVGGQMDAALSKCRQLRTEMANVVLAAHGREQHLDPGESLALGVDDTLVVVTQHFEGGPQFIVALLSIENIRDISSKPLEKRVTARPKK